MRISRVVQPGRRLACGACAVSFDGADAHREHHRTEWHRYNLKRKVLSLAPAPLEFFDSLDPAVRQAFMDKDS